MQRQLSRRLISLSTGTDRRRDGGETRNVFIVSNAPPPVEALWGSLTADLEIAGGAPKLRPNWPIPSH